MWLWLHRVCSSWFHVIWVRFEFYLSSSKYKKQLWIWNRHFLSVAICFTYDLKKSSSKLWTSWVTTTYSNLSPNMYVLLYWNRPARASRPRRVRLRRLLLSPWCDIWLKIGSIYCVGSSWFSHVSTSWVHDWYFPRSGIWPGLIHGLLIVDMS